MSPTIDTFIYLKRDIEQSFQRVQTISQSSHYNQQEVDQLLNHISCTLDDLQKVNQFLNSSSNENQSVNTHSPNVSENENDFEEENIKLIRKNPNIQISNKEQTEKRFTISYSKENEQSSLFSNTTINLLPSSNEREDYIHHMKTQYDYWKNKIQSIKKNENQMEIIRLDQVSEEDHMIRKQDEQLEDIHHSIISLKNLTQNINFEINDHIRVLDNLETGMINSQNRVENLTKQTKHFLRTSNDGVGGHTYLFAIAVGLFFLIIILILFF